MLFKNGREIKIPTEAEQGINTYLWYNYLFICFSFNKLFRQDHSFFISAVSRKTFVRLSKTPSAKKKCIDVFWYKAFTFRSKRASRNKNGCWSFWKWTIPSKTSSIHKISVIFHQWPFNFTLSQMRHYWRDISLFREQHLDLKRFDSRSFDP